MSPVSRATGVALVVGGAVKVSAYVVTPLVLSTLAAAFVLTLLVGWLLSAGRG